MGAPDRIVRHLRLRAESESTVRRTAARLEDALRCASLPDAGARVLLVRRLELGPIPPGASPQTLSLLLERRVAAAGASWVHGAAPDADRATFVYFRDALEARCELALRLAKGAPCAGWYWPLAAPEIVPAESARANLRRIALAIASLPEALAALPAWVARLAAAGAAPALASAVGETEGAELLRAAGVPLYTRELAAPPGLPAPAVPGSKRAETRAPSQDRRVGPELAILPYWVQALAIAGGFKPPVHLHLAGSLTRIDPGRASAISPAMQRSAPEHAEVIAAPDAARQAPVRDRADSLSDPDEAGTGAREILSQAIEQTALPPISVDGAGQPFLADAARSACGGLLFLVPVLQRLGYAAWAEATPESRPAAVIRRMLAIVLERLEAPHDDPAWSLAASPQDAEDPAVAELARPWLTACRRWLRRNAGIGVASLVVRPASLSVTATHIDVFLGSDDVDMRVRRAGLDIDPGWLPWLGRVVTFHYGSGG